MVATKGGDQARVNQTTLDLVGDREIVIKRAFNGPARIVFDAWTKPELVRRWWAVSSLGDSMVSCDADVRVGGRYRYVLQHAPGVEFAFSGTYKEIEPATRLVFTEVFEPTAAGADPEDEGITVIVTFVERGGRTEVTLRSVCPSQEVRDAIIATGMESGMREQMEQLEELVATLREER
jgi:uncharacterized protein YndB with AHSA1/START domain